MGIVSTVINDNLQTADNGNLARNISFYQPAAPRRQTASLAIPVFIAQCYSRTSRRPETHAGTAAPGAASDTVGGVISALAI